MITVTITIQKETMDEVLDALTTLEISASDEVMHQCEEIREQICSGETSDTREESDLCDSDSTEEISLHCRMGKHDELHEEG